MVRSYALGDEIMNKQDNFRKTKAGVAICPFFIWTSENIGDLGHSENDVNLTHCTHPNNPDDYEGNCQSDVCPVIKMNKQSKQNNQNNQNKQQNEQRTKLNLSKFLAEKVVDRDSFTVCGVLDGQHKRDYQKLVDETAELIRDGLAEYERRETCVVPAFKSVISCSL